MSKIRAFWNDDQGLTLSEWVAMVVIIIWAVVTVGMAIFMFLGELTDPMIDFYSVLGWMPLGVIGGLFGEKAFEHIGRRGLRPPPISVTQENNQEGSVVIADEAWSQGSSSS